MKDVAGHTDFVQQADRPGGDQRRLLCRLDVHRIVRRKHCRDLSAKDRQGVVPRANAGKAAAAPQGDLVRLPVGPGMPCGTKNSRRTGAAY